MTDTIDGYAEAIAAVVRAEGDPRAEEELFRFADALEANDELRAALADPYVPAARRQQIVEDLLGTKASPVTLGAVSLVVGAGRGRDLPAIARRVGELRAHAAGHELAEVRTAVALSDEERRRLAEALTTAVGHPVDLRVIVDPSVVGGVVTTIGDTVIDGSVRTRLTQVKSRLA